MPDGVGAVEVAGPRLCAGAASGFIAGRPMNSCSLFIHLELPVLSGVSECASTLDTNCLELDYVFVSWLSSGGTPCVFY